MYWRTRGEERALGEGKCGCDSVGEDKEREREEEYMPRDIVSAHKTRNRGPAFRGEFPGNKWDWHFSEDLRVSRWRERSIRGAEWVRDREDIA